MIYNFDELSFQILSVDRFFHAEGFFDVKARTYAAFSFRTSGVGEFEVMNKRFVSRAGDILFLPAGVPYRVRYSDGKSIVVHFRDCNYQEAENISVGSRAVTEPAFERLLECWSTRHAVNQTKAYVYDILQKIANDRELLTVNTSFASCVQYLNEHFCEPDLEIQAICQHGYLSTSSLRRAFLEHFGVSPKQYLIKLRINRAMDLLMEGALSVKEIALTCGFADEKYFSRVFKEKYGCPPSHIKRKTFI